MEKKKLERKPVTNYQNLSEVFNSLRNTKQPRDIGCSCNGASSAQGSGGQPCCCGNAAKTIARR